MDSTNRRPARLSRLGTLFSSFTLFLASCAPSTGSEDYEELGATTAELVGGTCPTGQLSSALKTHACSHVLYGPFASRSANTPSRWFGTGTTVPGAGTTHVYYELQLNGTSAPYQGTFFFQPVDNGDHALLFDSGLSFTVQEVGGSLLSPDTAISPSPGSMSCTGFTGYEVYSLNNTKSYELTFSSSTATNHVLFEWVTGFRQRWYVDNDGDGFGDPLSPSIRTACEPPPTHPTTTAGDCNDGDPAIYFGAPETCGDGVDSNCDGNDCT